MKFLRAATRAIFYDFPLNVVGNHIYGRKKIGERKEKFEFIEIVQEILLNNETQFSRTEIRKLCEIVDSQWMSKSDDEKSFGNQIKRSFRILALCGSKFLDISKDSPAVEFPNLMRWRNLSLLISEDAVSLATLAASDVEKGRDISFRTNFFWEDVLNHNCKEINNAYNDGVAETHSHFEASSDNFSINWIALMNNPQLINNCDLQHKLFNKGFYKEIDNISIYTANNLTLKHWILLAVCLRAEIYCYCQDKSTNKKELIDFQNKLYAIKEFDSENIDNINNLIGTFKQDALRTAENEAFDYAIKANLKTILSQNPTAIESPFMIHYGERELIYRMLNLIFSGKGKDIVVDKFFLYLLIKNKFRREIIQTNLIKGFENFQNHQKLKDIFTKSENLNKICKKYAVQSYLQCNLNNTLEGRVSVGGIKSLKNIDLLCPIFSVNQRVGQKSIFYNSKQNLSFVVHFLKSQDSLKREENKIYLPTIHRHESLRAQLWEDIDIILLTIGDKSLSAPIVGLDVAGSELNCRPEVFAPMFRWARYCGFNNITYHAGEDFYDLLDGLRTIHELICFMDYKSGDRIGHALALGINVKNYYEQRENVIIIPQQILLDNLVWLEYYSKRNNITLQPATVFFIEQNFSLLSSEIGYVNSSRFEYYSGMTMRGDDIMTHSSLSKRNLVKRSKTFADIKPTPIAQQLHNEYETNIDIRRKGEIPIEIKLPVSFIQDVEKIQFALLKDVDKIGINIEVNPSSNLKIGGFKRYSELPLFKFHAPDSVGGFKLPVSINTDDRGIFSTSIRNEHSLIAASMYKEKDTEGNRRYTLRTIRQYLDCTIKYGKEMRFQPLQPHFLPQTNLAQ